MVAFFWLRKQCCQEVKDLHSIRQYFHANVKHFDDEAKKSKHKMFPQIISSQYVFGTKSIGTYCRLRSNVDLILPANTTTNWCGVIKKENHFEIRRKIKFQHAKIQLVSAQGCNVCLITNDKSISDLSTS